MSIDLLEGLEQVAHDRHSITTAGETYKRLHASSSDQAGTACMQLNPFSR
jgi:hypothetical protein